MRLISFDNEAGKNDFGTCCSGKTRPNLECEGFCRPRFRVCLKEYQVKIDTTSKCTFGDKITPELGPNNPIADTLENGFSNPIALPFPFTWPVSFIFYWLISYLRTEVRCDVSKHLFTFQIEN